MALDVTESLRRRVVARAFVAAWEAGGGRGGTGGVLICCLPWSFDHHRLSIPFETKRDETVPTPARDTSNIWAIISIFSHTG